MYYYTNKFSLECNTLPNISDSERQLICSLLYERRSHCTLPTTSHRETVCVCTGVPQNSFHAMQEKGYCCILWEFNNVLRSSLTTGTRGEFLHRDVAFVLFFSLLFSSPSSLLIGSFSKKMKLQGEGEREKEVPRGQKQKKVLWRVRQNKLEGGENEGFGNDHHGGWWWWWWFPAQTTHSHTHTYAYIQTYTELYPQNSTKFATVFSIWKSLSLVFQQSTFSLFHLHHDRRIPSLIF